MTFEPESFYQKGSDRLQYGNTAGDGRDDDGEANTNIDEPEPDPTPGGAGSAVNEPPDETDEDDLENLFNETIINANLKP